MLFLLRPRQTWIPYSLPRDPQQQMAYNEQLRTAYDSSRRLAPVTSDPAASPPSNLTDQLQTLAALRESGALTSEEFAAAKARLLATPDG